MDNFDLVLKQYLLFVKVEKGLAENSALSYENNLRRYLAFIQQEKKIREVEGISMRHIEIYLAELTGMGLAPSSIARNISSIRNFHEIAVVECYAHYNTSAFVELP